MIIWISGTSSSGKTSIGSLLQEKLNCNKTKCLLFTVDKYLSMLNGNYTKIFGRGNIYDKKLSMDLFKESDTYYLKKTEAGMRIQYGDASVRLFNGIPNVIYEMQKTGFDIIVDAYFETEEHINQIKELFGKIECYFFYLYCNKEQLELREKKRCNRIKGTAENWLNDFDCVNHHDCNSIDTSSQNPNDITDLIYKALGL